MSIRFRHYRYTNHTEIHQAIYSNTILPCTNKKHNRGVLACGPKREFFGDLKLMEAMMYYDPSTRPQTAFLEATWEAFGSHLGSIWELEAEEASGRHLDSKVATPPQRNAKVPFNFQFYDGFLKVGVPKYCKLQAIMLRGSRQRSGAGTKAP